VESVDHTSTRSPMTWNARDTHRQAPFDTSEPRLISVASFSARGSVLKGTSIVTTLESFCSHLRRCRCPHFKRGKISYHAQFGVKLFHHHLVGRGVCPSESVPNPEPHPPLVIALLRLVPNPSRREGTDSPALRPRCYAIYSGRSARMSVNGMHRLFEIFFWNGPASVEHRQHRR
jgi:hypothetical protein